MVELEEAQLCDNSSEKTVMVLEGYNNQDIAEEYRYLKKGREKVGIRFFSDYGLSYPRNATEVFLDALRIHFCVTPIVVVANPLSSFFKSVYGTRNEEHTRTLFTLFFHRLFHPQFYILSKNVNPDVVSVLTKIDYPEPPVRIYKDIDLPIVKLFEVIQN